MGDTLDGFTVTATVADNGINVLYQVRANAPTLGTGKLYAHKTLNSARAHDQDARAMLAHEAWLAQRMQTSRAADYLVAVHDPFPPGASARPFTCCTTGIAAKLCSNC